jgi:hypothetical protein
MPHEPLALPDLLARLPDEADFEAVCAAMMATERGRRFLAEFTARNRSADTNMLVRAIARVEAAIRGEPSAQWSANLNEIAAAIERIDALLAASMASDMYPAVEQIQDIAFVLHERPVEQSLCDALDGAIREIADALVRPDDAAGSVRKAAELLRVLAGRISAMIAPSTEPAEALAAVVANHESFVQAIAGLAKSLPSLADAVKPEAVAASESHAGAKAQGDLQPIEAELADTAPIETLNTPHDGAGSASEVAQSARPSSENVLLDAFESNPFSRNQTTRQISAGHEEPKDENSTQKPQNPDGDGDVPPSGDMIPTRGISSEPVVSPEEDPADLFEPIPASAPLPAVAADAVEPPPQTLPQRIATTPASRAISPPPTSDPLAAVRALSAEELIALFS